MVSTPDCVVCGCSVVVDGVDGVDDFGAVDALDKAAYLG